VVVFRELIGGSKPSQKKNARQKKETINYLIQSFQMFRTNTDLQSFFKKSADLVDAQAGCDGLAGNKSIQPHGVDGVLPVLLQE
jgi:hypothetical protein